MHACMPLSKPCRVARGRLGAACNMADGQQQDSTKTQGAPEKLMLPQWPLPRLAATEPVLYCRHLLHAIQGSMSMPSQIHKDGEQGSTFAAGSTLETKAWEAQHSSNVAIQK